MQPEQQQRIMGYFIEEAKDHLNTIEQGLLNLQTTIGDPEMLNEVFRAAHSVKGGAAMLGIGSIQKTAHRLEDYFKILKEHQSPVDQTVESLLLRVFDALQELLDQLQEPLGLTEDKTEAVMSQVEPIFERLDGQLNAIAERETPPEPVVATVIPPSVTPAASVVPAKIEDSALLLVFQSDIPAQLREMLQLFKQPDTPDSRRQILEICRTLQQAGEQFDLVAWVSLVEAVKGASANLDNSYRTLAPVAIKELKQAQELVLAGVGGKIQVSQSLQQLQPTDPLATVIQDLSTSEDDFVFSMSESPEDSTGDQSPEFLTWSGLGFDDESPETPAASSLDRDFKDPLPVNRHAEHTGPEVGMAELSTLAELFAGETPDLNLGWQEEELFDSSPKPVPVAAQDESNDFSEFLFETHEPATATANQENLGDDDFGNLFDDLSLETEELKSASGNQPTPVMVSVEEDSDFADLLGIGSTEELKDELELEPEGLEFGEEPLAFADEGDRQIALSLDDFTIEATPESSDLDDFGGLFAETTEEELDFSLDQPDLTESTEELDQIESEFSLNIEPEAELSEPETSADEWDSLGLDDALELEESEDVNLDLQAEAFTETAESDFDLGLETEEELLETPNADLLSLEPEPSNGLMLGLEESSDELMLGLEESSDELMLGLEESSDESMLGLEESSDESMLGLEESSDELMLGLEEPSDELMLGLEEPSDELMLGLEEPSDELMLGLEEPSTPSELSLGQLEREPDPIEDFFSLDKAPAPSQGNRKGDRNSPQADLSEDFWTTEFNTGGTASLSTDQTTSALEDNLLSSVSQTPSVTPKVSEPAQPFTEMSLSSNEADLTLSQESLELENIDIDDELTLEVDDQQASLTESLGEDNLEINEFEGLAELETPEVLEELSLEAESLLMEEVTATAEADLGDLTLETSSAEISENGSDSSFDLDESPFESEAHEVEDLGLFETEESADTGESLFSAEASDLGLFETEESADTGESLFGEEASDLGLFETEESTDTGESLFGEEASDLGLFETEESTDTGESLFGEEASDLGLFETEESTDTGESLFGEEASDLGLFETEESTDTGESLFGEEASDLGLFTEVTDESDANLFSFGETSEEQLDSAVPTLSNESPKEPAFPSISESEESAEFSFDLGESEETDLSLFATDETVGEIKGETDEFSFDLGESFFTSVTSESVEDDFGFLNEDLTASSPELTDELSLDFGEQFSDLDGESANLIAEMPGKLTEDLAGAGETANFEELEAVLGNDDLTAAQEYARRSQAVFTELEAYLDTDSTPAQSREVSEAGTQRKPISAESKQPAGVQESAPTGTEFDDLEELLADADKTLGGPPTVITSRGTAPAAMPRRSRVTEQNMRVPVKQLDNLSNLVGELVVNRNSLEQDQERLRLCLDNLLYQVQQLSDVGGRMRDLYERSLLESALLSTRIGKNKGKTKSDNNNSPYSSHATGEVWEREELDLFTPFHTLSQETIELIVRVRESASDIEFIVDEIDQITRQFRQVTTQLQEGLTRTRMVPFAQTADRLPGAVRRLCMELNRQADITVEGRETLIDKMIQEQLFDPMTHLINNAMTHGIEPPHIRQAAGKPPMGRINVRAFHQGNQTVISVSDDGAGIDAQKVLNKAIQQRLVTPEEAKSMSRNEVYNLLFRPGFSTKDKADNFAGRGVGMDVVLTSLREMRGTIHTDSILGKGTTFTIRLPLTLSISKALCCISSRSRIAFPMDGVEDMLDVPRERIQMNAEGQACIAWRDNILPFRPLGDLLKYNRQIGRGSVYGGNQEEDIISIVVLRSAGQFTAVQVDQVMGEQEIVIKQLEGPVPKPLGIAGATVLGDGRIMPIADVLELIDLSLGRTRHEAKNLWQQEAVTIPEAPAATHEKTVLIVDDSITVRELLSMTFNKAGYRVEQARDGQDAWEKLRAGLPCDIVFCDIEMPRMDGLELLSRLQKDPALKHLPIAMLTSRGADRHRQTAASLGASGYFTKPYLEEALLEAAQRMLKGEVLVNAKSMSQS